MYELDLGQGHRQSWGRSWAQEIMPLVSNSIFSQKFCQPNQAHVYLDWSLPVHCHLASPMVSTWYAVTTTPGHFYSGDLKILNGYL